MKDQYVGDVNDYLKYSLLRALGGGDVRLLVCWMLTPPDGRSDGGQLAYLLEPSRSRPVDPVLFDALSTLVTDGRRSVADVEHLGILRDASFDATLVPQEVAARKRWIHDVIRRGADHDILFFDPDNGVEVASVPKGRVGSEKYLYWDELGQALEAGPSVVVYQHFPRRGREEFARALIERISVSTPRRSPFAVYDARVMYIVVPDAALKDRLRADARALSQRWYRQLRVFEL